MSAGLYPKENLYKGEESQRQRTLLVKSIFDVGQGSTNFFCKGGVVSFFGFGHQRPLQPRLPLLVNAETATDNAETNGLALCQHDRQK